MIFIVFDSFVCTSFIQPVQRIQFKTGPGSQASGAGELFLLLCKSLIIESVIIYNGDKIK